MRLLVLAILLTSSRGQNSRTQHALSDFSLSAAVTCDILLEQFPGQVVFPREPQYNESQSTYWSLQQTELEPACRIFPSSAIDVRDALSIVTAHDTPFAVVSGGHSSNIHASNINGPGITVDLALLCETVIVDGGGAVQLGPGCTWSEVYAALEPHNLTVVGARISHVGVGGFVLGGGFSWFADETGWACDSVIEFEIVTPDLRLLQVNESQYSDLFWALKGSLGAFGIVTQIKMRTIVTTGEIYRGLLTYDMTVMPEVFAALEMLATELDPVDSTKGYISIGYNHTTRSFVHVVYLVNTQAKASQSVFTNFTRIPYNSIDLRPMTLRMSADETSQSNLPGFRRAKFTLTTYPTVSAMRILHQNFQNAAKSLAFDDNELLGITFQPLTRSHLSAVTGNIFSSRLSDAPQPLLLVSIELWWQDDTRDDEFDRQMRFLHSRMIAELNQLQLVHPWIYPNYAAAWQEPLGFNSLTAGTLRKLGEISEVYDGERVWPRLVPGIWHPRTDALAGDG